MTIEQIDCQKTQAQHFKNFHLPLQFCFYKPIKLRSLLGKWRTQYSFIHEIVCEVHRIGSCSGVSLGDRSEFKVN